MANAKDNLNILLHAYVSASASSDEEKWVKLSDIETHLNDNNVYFTTGSADNSTNMTERAQKLACGSSVRQFKKCLEAEGLSDAAITKEVNSLKLKKVKSRPKMTKTEGFDFEAFRKKLKNAAN